MLKVGADGRCDTNSILHCDRIVMKQKTRCYHLLQNVEPFAGNEMNYYYSYVAWDLIADHTIRGFI